MQNSGYMDQAMLDLIEHLDFVPIRDSLGKYIIKGPSRHLEKLDVGVYRRVHIIDGEFYSELRIRKHIEDSILYLKNATNERMEEIEFTVILLSVNRQEGLTFDDVENYCMEEDNFNIIVVNLAEGRVTGGGQGDSYHAVEYIMHERFEKRIPDRRRVLNIDNFIRKESPRIEPENVTNKTPVTYSLILTNLLIWLAAWVITAVTGFNHLTDLGLKEPYWIAAGQYWRLITPIFLHADIMHLAANSFSLFIFGQVVERLFGSRKFFILYMVSGIVGNIASFVFVPAKSLGASGAVLGVGAALVYLWRRNRDALYSRRRQYLTLIFLVFFNIIYGLSRPGIDNFAHFGGALGGFLTAGILGIKHFRESKDKRMLYAAVLLILVIAGLAIGFSKYSGYGYGRGFF